MSLLPRKGLLAIAAVIDVALNARERPVSARKLAARHNLPPRHLEPVLQALVHEGILNGIRGPRGGYELARERRRITVADILRAAGTIDDGGTTCRRARASSTRSCCRRSPRPSARSRRRSRGQLAIWRRRNLRTSVTATIFRADLRDQRHSETCARRSRLWTAGTAPPRDPANRFSHQDISRSGASALPHRSRSGLLRRESPWG